MLHSIFATLLLCLAMSCGAYQGANEAFVSMAPTTEQIRKSFYFESHGRDDVREWPAVIMKGAQLIKIDINYREDPFDCLHQTLLPPSTNNYKNGCFLLCHYYANRTRDFNTTWDVITFVNSSANDRLLDGRTYGPITFQLCFKNRPSMTNPPSASATKWLNLMKEFFDAMNPILQRPERRQVQFVFDNFDNYIPQLAMFSPWNSTWVGHFASAMNNNETDGNAMFQMVNMKVINPAWAKLAQGNFYKFADNLYYPFIGWEPSSEGTIAAYYEQMLSYRFLNPYGWLVAFNPDPALYHTYTSNCTHRFAHQAIGHKDMGSSVTTLLDLPGSGPGTPGNVQLTLTFTQSKVTGIRYFHVHGIGEDSSLVPITTQEFTFPTERLPTGFPKSFIIIRADAIQKGEFGNTSINAFTNFVWIYDVRGCSITFMLNVTFDSSFRQILSTNFAVSEEADAMWCPTFPTGVEPTDATSTFFTVSDYFNNHFSGQYRNTVSEGVMAIFPFWIAAYDPRHGGSFTLSAFAFQDNVNSSNPIGPTLHEKYSITEGSKVVAANVGSYVSHFTVAATITGASGPAEFQGSLVLSWSANRSVYVVTVPLGVRFNRTSLRMEIDFIGESTPPVGTAAVKLGVGNDPSVAITSTASRTNSSEFSAVAMVAYGESFCYNNMAVDDDFFIFRGVKVCDLQNAEVYEFIEQPILSYAFGYLDDFNEEIMKQQENPKRHGLATTCSTKIFHGVFDVAHYPSALILNKHAGRDISVQDGGFLGIASVTSLDQEITTDCGSPGHKEGRIVMDSFPLNGFYNMTSVFSSRP